MHVPIPLRFPAAHGGKKTLRRFSRSENGATAIEFAIIGPVFFAIIGATIETALAFFAGYALDAAVIDTSRLIRTGQPAYITSNSGDNYRAAVCDRLYGIFACEDIRISVRPLPSFGNFTPSDPIDAVTGEWRVANAHPSVPGNTPIVIEAYYKWPTFFNIPGINAGQTADGKRLLAASYVLRTEPYL